MKPAGIVGVLLIAIGIIALAYGGFGWINYTQREKVVDLGPLQVSADKEKRVPLSPIVGGVCLAGGILMVLAGNKKA